MNDDIYRVYHFRCPDFRIEEQLLVERKIYDYTTTFVYSDRVASRGGATVVILKDGSLGISFCSMKDNYDKKEGYKVAREDALDDPIFRLDMDYYKDKDYLEQYVDLFHIADGKRMAIPLPIRTDIFYPVCSSKQREE